MNEPMPRLIIHAGFPKTGSSSIQTGLKRHIRELIDQRFFVFGKNMEIDLDCDQRGGPLPFLENAGNKWPERKTLLDHLVRCAGMVDEGAVLLLSAENLSHSGLYRLFAGIDEILETQIVFYVRPQTVWIPSAWKQWGLKTGRPITKYIASCLKNGTPAYARNLDEWAGALPKAKITVRPFFRELLAGKNPAIDFFKLIGFENYDTSRLKDQVNPSIDYALLHVLMLGAKSSFKGVHDNRMYNALLNVLPSQYKKTNIAMLSNEAADQIEKHFHDENLYILQTYCGLSEDFYNQYFLPRHHAENYMDKSESEILQRAFAILSEVRGSDWAARLLTASLADDASEIRRKERSQIRQWRPFSVRLRRR